MITEGGPLPHELQGPAARRDAWHIGQTLSAELRRPVVEYSRGGELRASPGVAGYLAIGDVRLLIVPKVFRTTSADEWGLGLPLFLNRCDTLRSTAVAISGLGSFAASGVFVSWWADFYARSLERALRIDPHLRYEPVHARLPYVRGRVLWQRQAGEWARGGSKLHCAFRAQRVDNPLNRLLKWAALRFIRLSGGGRQLPRLGRCLEVLADVQDRLPPRAVISRLRVSPALLAYRRPLEIARALAMGQQPTLAPGRLPASGIVVDMAAAFEAFVRGMVGEAVAQANAKDARQLMHRSQDQCDLALAVDGGSSYATRPDDIVYEAADPGSGVVLDAKYKGIADEGRYARPTSADVYQAVAACLARKWSSAIVISPVVAGEPSAAQHWRVTRATPPIRISHLRLALDRLRSASDVSELAGQIRLAVLGELSAPAEAQHANAFPPA